MHVPTAETVNTTDAIWSLIVNQKKSVQKTIASRLSALLEEDKREAQQAYVRESLTSALDEVRKAHSSGKKLPDARHLFDDLECVTITKTKHEDVPNDVTLAAMREAESGNDAGEVKLDSIESFVASMM